MIDLTRDPKAKRTVWIITHTDSEGFHRQLAMSDEDMTELVRRWTIMHKI